jgi:hypothetical protein
MRLMLGFVLLLVLSLIVLAMPARSEGPILLTITAITGWRDRPVAYGGRS